VNRANLRPPLGRPQGPLPRPQRHRRHRRAGRMRRADACFAAPAGYI